MRPIWQLGVRAGTIFFAITLIFSAALGAQDTRLRVPLPWKPDDPNSQIRDASSLPQIAPTLTTGTWTAIGPAPITNGQRPGSGPVSGRLTGIAAHPTDPNTIYVAAAGGGVWKTTDGGTTWNPLTDSQSTLSMGAIAIAPSNPLVLYTGTGEANFSVDSDFGRGVLVSTDGGATWTLRTAGGLFDGEQISEIAIDPTNSNIAYVAVASGFEGGNSGVWKTTDGGVTWTNTSPSDLRGNFWTSVRIDPTSPSTLYAAQSNIQGPFGALSEGAVYKTTNGGMSWTRLTNAPSGVGAGRIVVAVSRTNPQVIYVSAAASPRSGTLFGSLYKFERSDDGGATFTDLTAGTPNYLGALGEYATTLIVDPFNSAIVFAAGQFSILRSTNSGLNWTDISSGPSGGPHADHHAATFDANGRYVDGDDGGVYRLDNPATITWTQLNGNLNTIQFLGIALHPTDPNNVLGGSQDNGTSHYSGGLGWTLVEGGDGGFVKFSKTNPSRVYHQAPVIAFGPENFFRRSDAGGAAGTWVSKVSGITDNSNSPQNFLQNFYAPFAVDPNNGDRVLYGARHVWETTNGGDSWTALGVVAEFGLPVDAIGLSPSDPNTIYVAVQNLIYVTTNRGATWEWPNNSACGNGDIQVDPNNANTAYAACRFPPGFGTPGVSRTTNGGVTWTDITGNLPAARNWSLQIDPNAPGTLYVGNDTGVYRTENSGATWSRFGSGLPNAQVFEIDLNTSLGILGAATHGRGAWEILTGTPTTTTTTTTVSAAAGQYSDGVTLKATVSPVGAGGSVGFLVNGSAIPGSATYDSTTGIATQSYAITQGQGTYQIKAIFAPSTSSFTGSTGTNSLVVSREDAVITPSPSNPTAVKANTPGGTAGPITVTATIVEKADDTTQGNTSLAVPVTCTLNPLLPGATYTVTATTRGGGIGGTLTATCLFPSVTVNTYLFVTSIGGNYYTGSSQSLLAVYDPSLGFVTGSGTITRNGNLAEFGFNAKYSSNGTLLANVLYVEHQPTGDVVVQSVATQSLSIIENLAAIVTKGVVNGTGDYTLITTVTDNGEPGINLDLFGLEVRDSSGAIVSGLTFPKTRIIRGNIQVHSSKRNN